MIHFNFGLHDIKMMGATQQVPPAQYEQNLEKLVQEMKQTGAKLIFATTTPVPDGPVRPPRVPGDVLKYNEIATRVMTENGVAIDDLYSLIKPREAELQVKNNVHFSKAGYQMLAQSVTASVEKALNGK